MRGRRHPYGGRLRREAPKIVVKRPVKGPFLAEVKPSYQVVGKAVRYDVIVPAHP